MELVDIVDVEDNVTGATNVVEAHKNRLVHRVAAVFVFNSEGALYVQVHKKSGGRLDHSVGGHVAKGESYLIAAAREAAEELGISQPLDEVSASLYSDEDEYIHMFGIFECIADKKWNFVPNEEVGEIIPMKLDEIRELMKESPEKFTGGFCNTMKEYCRVKGL